jgi:hypothetical protein
VLLAGASTAAATQADYDKGYELGLDAYRYGLPIVTMDKTFKNQTSVNRPNGDGFGPVNRFNPVREFTDPDDLSVVAPNWDTLYDIAWLNLKKQPQVIHVPKLDDRYYVFPLMTPYTENFANLGSVNKTKPGDYAVVGPDDRKVKLPKGVKKIKSPYDRVWIIQRTFADQGSKKDIEKINRFQDRTTVTPLDKYGKKNWKPKNAKPKDTEVNDPPLPTGMDFYTRLGKELDKFPPPAADDAELEKLAEVGIGPGMDPGDAGLDPDTLQGLEDAADDGPGTVDNDLKALYLGSFVDHNGYLVTPTGNYGTDYRLRAVVTDVGLGAVPPTESIYPLSQTDGSLAPLVGSKKYVLHIPAGQLPPVQKKGFWSLTMYDTSGYFVPNPIDRFAINDRTDLNYNQDGSLDLYVQSTEPADPAEAQNWLPSPGDGGPFRLMWRMFGPKGGAVDGILDGTGWRPPMVQTLP